MSAASARQKRALRAVAKLKSLAREEPTARPGLLLRIAHLYRRGGMLAEARRVLDRLLRHDPFDLGALLALAWVLHESGEAEAALTVCRSLQQAVPSMEEPYLLELRSLESLDRTEELTRALEAYLGRWPDRPIARLELAGWFEALGRPGGAIAQYKQLVECGYRPAGVYERMGALYFRAGDLLPALRCFEQVERLAPGRPRVREAIARIHYSLEHWPQAFSAARQLVQSAPSSLPARRLLARAALRAGAFEEAAVAYEAVLEANPDSPSERREYAEALFFNGDIRDSAAEYRRVIAADPKDGLAHFRLAEVLREGYFLEEAQEHYRIASELMPGASQPLERLGLMALAAHRYHQSVSLFLRWMMLEPANPDVHLALGKAYRQLGEVASSRKHFQRAEELGDRSASLLYERVLLERIAGQDGPARQFIQRALLAEPDARTSALLHHELREIELAETRRALKDADAAAEASKPKPHWKKLA